MRMLLLTYFFDRWAVGKIDLLRFCRGVNSLFCTAQIIPYKWPMEISPVSSEKSLV